MHLGTSLARASRCARRARRVERERRARRELSSVSRCSTARTIRAPVVECSDSSSLVDSNETRERRGGSPTDDERRRTSIDGIGVGDMTSRGRTSKKQFGAEAFATVATPWRRGIDFPMERTSSRAAVRSWIERNVRKNGDDRVKNISKEVRDLCREWGLKGPSGGDARHGPIETLEEGFSRRFHRVRGERFEIDR